MLLFVCLLKYLWAAVQWAVQRKPDDVRNRTVRPEMDAVRGPGWRKPPNLLRRPSCLQVSLLSSEGKGLKKLFWRYFIKKLFLYFLSSVKYHSELRCVVVTVGDGEQSSFLRWFQTHALVASNQSFVLSSVSRAIIECNHRKSHHSSSNYTRNSTAVQSKYVHHSITTASLTTRPQSETSHFTATTPWRSTHKQNKFCQFQASMFVCTRLNKHWPAL